MFGCCGVSYLMDDEKFLMVGLEYCCETIVVVTSKMRALDVSPPCRLLSVVSCFASWQHNLGLVGDMVGTFVVSGWCSMLVRNRCFVAMSMEVM